ncbi:MAG: hypothetical protein FGM33_01385 [Candidatus Kapabacteria bacterium]|nr:hypothetical protein [Candidatus Kapabacteria bacterium]
MRNQYLFGLLILLLVGHDGHKASTDRRQQLRSVISSIARHSDSLVTNNVRKAVASIQSGNTQDALRHYEGIRQAYKAIEPLIEHIDPSMVTMQLNGAPLPKLDAKSQFVDVLEPHGLQVIDEMFGADQDSVIANGDELTKELLQFSVNMHSAAALISNTPWTDRLVLESCRTGIMRLTTMGISSFDRPATEPFLSENLAIMRTIRMLVICYRDVCQQNDLAALYEQALTLIDGTGPYFGQSDGALDKAELIRTILDPLYGSIARLQIGLGIELSTEVSPSQPVVNPTAESMFSSSTLMPTASSGIHYNSISNDLLDLGKVLFFDPILSDNAERACASCHQPERAFTDGLAKGLAFDHQGTILRNTPTLINSVYARRFFFDLRAQRISDVVAHVITDQQEFHSSLIDVVGRIRASSEYVEMFERVFGRRGAESIDATNISMAIGAYLTTLVSMNSRMDRYLRGESVTISASERRGFNLFMGKAACASCHFPPTYAGYVPPTFVESESEIIGVPARHDTVNALEDSDVGRAGGILRENSVIYRGSFKTPTVRNIALTAPYFHNGSYESLEQVMDFYVRGGGAGIGLHVPYQTLPFDRLELTRQDQDDIIAFMKALTDTSLKVNPPARLPSIGSSKTDRRPIGGRY